MIDRDYKCVIYLGAVIKNRRGEESLAFSKKWPKMHFEEKILEKKHVYILVTKIIFKEHETVTKQVTWTVSPLKETIATKHNWCYCRIWQSVARIVWLPDSAIAWSKCNSLNFTLFTFNFCVKMYFSSDFTKCFNPKRARLFGPISQPGGGGGFRPLRSRKPIDETSSVWYYLIAMTLPSPLVPKKIQTYLVWRHSDVIRDVISKTQKSQKIAKIMVFRYFFQAKVAFFGNGVCQSMLTHVLTPNKPNK